MQNSPYFCVFKYALAVKQKVWNEAEIKQRARLGRDANTRPGRVRLARSALVRLLHATDLLILRKKPTVFQSNIAVATSMPSFCPHLWFLLLLFQIA